MNSILTFINKKSVALMDSFEFEIIDSINFSRANSDSIIGATIPETSIERQLFKSEIASHPPILV